MKIWHDNSGKGDKASWFLKYIIVKDLQTREKFYFICQKWLAVEKGDGKLERDLFVASEWQKKELKYLMEKQSRHYLMDNHLWMSVFYRPVQSSFTRLDRVTCCFLFHYISMFLNIVCYGIVSISATKSNLNKLDLTLFKISLQQVNYNISISISN
jgi:polycystin 1L2